MSTTMPDYIAEADASFEAPLTMTKSEFPKRQAPKSLLKPVVVSDLWDEEFEDDSPSVGNIEGGSALLYEGTDHYIVGPAGGGKTYLSMHLIHDHVRSNSFATVLFVDYESTVQRFIRRLKQIGVTKEQGGQIAYLKPQGSLMKEHKYGKEFHAWIEEHRPSFVVIDSVAVAMSAGGLNENDNGDASAWWYGVVQPLNNLRVTNLRIDHVGKPDGMGRAQTTPRGGSAKTDRVDGAGYYFRTDTHWSKKRSGLASLLTIKDRGGEYTPGSVVCEMHVEVIDDGAEMHIELKAPPVTPTNDDGSIRLTGLMGKISRIVQDSPDPVSMGVLKSQMKAKDKTVIDTVDLMVSEGFLSVTTGPRNSKLLESVKPYIESEDPKSDKYEAPTEQLGDAKDLTGLLDGPF